MRPRGAIGARGRSFIWAGPLRERPFDRRFLAYSALIHIAAFALLHSESFDLANRGTGRPAPARALSHASAASEPLHPIEVIEIVEVVPRSERPVPEREAPEPEPLDVERALRSVATGTPETSVSVPSAPAAVGGTGGAFIPPAPLVYRWANVPEGASSDGGPVTVIVRIHVDTAGAVTHAELGDVTASDALNAEALDMARQMRFRPAEREGRPVAAWIELPFAFDR